jgi:hypothetical protein
LQARRVGDTRVRSIRFGAAGLLTASWDGTYGWSALGPLTATPAALTAASVAAWGPLYE